MLQISGFSHAFLLCGHKREPLVHSCGLRNVLFVHQKSVETSYGNFCGRLHIFFKWQKKYCTLILGALIQRLYQLCLVITET